MIRKEVIIQNPSGLNARPAALFVKQTNKFLSDIFAEKGTKKINAKSIIGIMSLSIQKGDEIVLVIDGPDEEDAAKELNQFFENILPKI